jgi:hypothetical protein
MRAADHPIAFRAAAIAAVAVIALGGTALAAPKNGDELLRTRRTDWSR